MRVTLNEDETQLVASVERLLDGEYGFDRHRRTAETGGGFDHGFWRVMADQGWMAACLPESAGGYGQSPNDALLILERCGAALVVEPLLSGFVVPAMALATANGGGHGGGEAGPAAIWLPRMLAGDAVAALAWTEPGRRYDPRPRQVTASRGPDGGWVLEGRKSAVLSAPLAAVLIVSAATDAGTALFAVPGDAAGMTLAGHEMIDGQRAADIVFDAVALADEALLARPGAGSDAVLAAALDWGAAGAAAEAVGSMAAAVALTVEYARTRSQFGRSLSGFQVIQHRLAALATEVEYARALLPLLADRLTAAPEVRRAAVSAARSAITAAARRVTADTVQLHGGIGVTNEAEVSHHFRRVAALDLGWGGAREHLARYRTAPSRYAALSSG
ncbi:acyl-CoA/acyl-ACP dehydrogenase (plasmid) [Tistrella bauzanensis]|uniref:acyl-CoA dehydrogenase family protein n=1 Tax=Tistrella TaxID=171436 RepID=UPI0031F66D85